VDTPGNIQPGALDGRMVDGGNLRKGSQNLYGGRLAQWKKDLADILNLSILSP